MVWEITEGKSISQVKFDRLYDSRQLAHNIIEILDSVEVVGTIREALER